MAFDTKKYLDSTGLSHLWEKIEGELKNRDTEIGTLTSLTTDAKDNLVVAINELDSHVDANTTAIGTAKNGETAGTGLTGRIEVLEDSSSKTSVTVEKSDTAEEGFTATYIVKQNGTQVGASINIPKDYLVKSGTLETASEADKPVEGLKVGDKYLDFIVNTVDNEDTASHIYLPVNDLFDSYASGSVSTDAVIITVDNTKNEITASITDGTISRAKIDSSFEANITAVENAVTTLNGANTVDGSVAKTIKTAIEDLDAEKSQTAGTDGLALSITEVDGKITAISGSIAANTYDAYGEASAAYNAIIALTNAEIDTAITAGKTAANSNAE